MNVGFLYENNVEAMYSYNPLMLILPIINIIPLIMPFKISEYGVSIENMNITWNRIKSYEWVTNNRIKIAVKRKF